MTDLQCLPYRISPRWIVLGNGMWYGRSHDCPWSNRWPCEVSPMRIDKHVWLFICVAVSLLWMMSNCTLQKGWVVMVSVLTVPPGVILWGLYLRMWDPSLPKPFITSVCCCLINLHDAMSPVSTQQYGAVRYVGLRYFLRRLYYGEPLWDLEEVSKLHPTERSAHLDKFSYRENKAQQKLKWTNLFFYKAGTKQIMYLSKYVYTARRLFYSCLHILWVIQFSNPILKNRFAKRLLPLLHSKKVSCSIPVVCNYILSPCLLRFCPSGSTFADP